MNIPDTQEIQNMMETLKVGLLGLAMGALGAVALSSLEAQAQDCASKPRMTRANPVVCMAKYLSCRLTAHGNPAVILACEIQFEMCQRH